MKKGARVIDLGAAPGSWSQYLSKKIKNSKVVSIDLLEMEPIDNIVQIKGDFIEEKNQLKVKNFFKSNVDVVLSDMAVNTTGNKNVDSIVTGELCLEAMKFAVDTLNQNGKFVSKIFKKRLFLYPSKIL